ncbi:acetyltransferase, ribosomal protein N-acetylase [Rivularia sp. PCC 7116]|uniref:GNAT family N-acetyltransferase n=1 Tax=Rivularia sp. PCC 7116 TaxID=373994 RepID=UPI00029EC3B0|nr:GNAT family protein [Rivularia sp. PCC 7116]AFY54560.1 acetyltransferase, ribosomal protein N-acetylase [Rivularia sp. PCC 7116]
MLSQFPELETENLLLRQVNQSDAKAIFKHFSDKEVLRYHDLEAFTNIEQAKNIIASFYHKFHSQQMIRWGIAKKEDNVIIGTCGFHNWVQKSFQAEIGYELSQAYWRKGIMTEALTAMIKFGFKKMELNRITATVMLENIASMKLLENNGFVEEGVLREHGFWKGGFHDLKIFALLKKEALQYLKE